MATKSIVSAGKRRMGRFLVVGFLVGFTVALCRDFLASALTSARVPREIPGNFEPQKIDARLQPYLKVLRERGEEPIHFVLEKLTTHDLIIFDDAHHTSLEAFEFYQRLIEDEAFKQKLTLIFLEVVPINKQRHLDAYLNATSDDPSLLFPAFQDHVNGRGWNLKTYFDLLRTVRVVNQRIPVEKKIRVLGVDCPTFWSEIQTRQDLEQFNKSLATRDHHMYAVIVNELAEFKENRKGILLTNTRHAYKGLRRNDGQFFWNSATFFHQWHPGKAYSIRLHNSTTEAVKGRASADGRETLEYRSVRMAHGLWDSAFRAAGDRPVALPLQGNEFGEEPYIGADLDTMPGQKMQDVYDAVIFLAPLEKMSQCALVDSIYTAAFKQELKRRFGLMYSEAQLIEVFKKFQARNLDELFVYLEKNLGACPVQPLPEAQSVGPIDEWKSNIKE